VAKEVPDLRRDASETTKGDERVGEEEALRCAACGHEIATRRDAIEMSGAHEHTFVNPSGVVFHVACFRDAAGCVEVGDEEATFTWFPGWTWQIAICGQCRAHLGWKFRLAPDAFWGLIRTKLRG
jgi:hypothetical protein